MMLRQGISVINLDIQVDHAISRIAALVFFMSYWKLMGSNLHY